MPVSRDEVALCYRHLLGREPENDFVVREKVRGHADLRQLIETFVASAEYRLKLESDGRALRIDEVEVRHAELTQALVEQRAERRRTDDLKSDVRQKLAILRNQDYAIVKRIVLDHAPRHWRAYALALAATTFVSFSASLYAYLIGNIVNVTFTQKNFSAIVVLSIAWIVLFALRGLAIYAQDTLLARAANRITAETQQRTFDKLLTQNVQFFADRHSSEFMANAVIGSSSFASILNQLTLAIGRDCFMVVCLIGLMVWLDPVLSLISLAVFPPALLGVERLVDRARAIAATQFSGATNMLGTMQEVVQGIRIVKAFNLEQAVRRRIDGGIDKLERASNDLARVSSWSSPLVETFGGIAIALACLYGGYRVLNDNALPGEFVSFVLAFILTFEPARRLARLKIDLSSALVMAHGTLALLDTPPSEADEPDKPALRVDAGQISLTNIEFAYRRGLPVLRQLALTAEPGRMTALVGPSGGGKTTIFNLLLRFNEMQSGAITIDGQDIRRVSRRSLRDHITYVGQEIYLFHGTVRENILTGKPDASEDELIAAAKGAFAYDFISALPASFDTQIGEGGAQLSMGQRQRIAIARAMIKAAPIVLLDEPTASLDSESEHYVQEAIRRLCQGRTTLAIAHRLNTIRDADKICVIEHGTVVEEGSHDQLMQRNGRYATFYRLQFRDTP